MSRVQVPLPAPFTASFGPSQVSSGTSASASHRRMPRAMPIFRRAPATGHPTAGAAAAAGAAGDAAAGERRGAAVTFIAPGTRIRGELGGTTDVQIEGEIAGNVDVDALVVVGARGSVLGPLHGRAVRVSGQVAGNVTAAERVEVGAAGSVEGDIAAPRVVIAEGAFFKGKIDMKSDHNRESRRSAKAGAETSKTTAAPPAREAPGSNASNAAHATHEVDTAEAGSK